MRDANETFVFIEKYHQDLGATLRGLSVSKPIHELTESDRRDWIVSYRFAMIVLRDIGRFILGIGQPQVDLDFDEDPFTDIGRYEVERKVAKQQNPQNEVGDDREKRLASMMRLAAAQGIIESTDRFERSQRTGKRQRVFRSLIHRE